MNSLVLVVLPQTIFWALNIGVSLASVIEHWRWSPAWEKWAGAIYLLLLLSVGSMVTVASCRRKPFVTV